MENKIRILLFLTFVIYFNACEDSTSPLKNTSTLSGKITNSATGTSVPQVFIFLEDSLLTTLIKKTDYSFELESGMSLLTFSAIGYEDKKLELNLNENTTQNIELIPSSDKGRVYGEFQDIIKFQENVEENENMETWNEEEIYDGVTGATILEENSVTTFQQAELFIADSLLRYGDVYGQYWFEIQTGTYPISGKCEGYSSKTQIITVLPNTKTYLNYYLKPE